MEDFEKKAIELATHKPILYTVHNGKRRKSPSIPGH
jgi:hypothetical protein